MFFFCLRQTYSCRYSCGFIYYTYSRKNMGKITSRERYREKERIRKKNVHLEKLQVPNHSSIRHKYVCYYIECVHLRKRIFNRSIFVENFLKHFSHHVYPLYDKLKIMKTKRFYCRSIPYRFNRLHVGKAFGPEYYGPGAMDLFFKNKTLTFRRS